MRSRTRAMLAIGATAAVMTASTFSASAARKSATATPMSTKEVMLAFERLAFDERKPREAMELYAAPDFIDHDPNVSGDKASVIAHLEKLDWSTGGPQRTILHLIVEGDIAMVHHRLVRKPGAPAIAAVDIFRVKNGKFVEHWDVLQPVPADNVNKRAMF